MAKDGLWKASQSRGARSAAKRRAERRTRKVGPIEAALWGILAANRTRRDLHKDQLTLPNPPGGDA